MTVRWKTSHGNFGTWDWELGITCHGQARDWFFRSEPPTLEALELTLTSDYGTF